MIESHIILWLNRYEKVGGESKWKYIRGEPYDNWVEDTVGDAILTAAAAATAMTLPDGCIVHPPWPTLYQVIALVSVLTLVFPFHPFSILLLVDAMHDQVLEMLHFLVTVLHSHPHAQ